MPHDAKFPLVFGWTSSRLVHEMMHLFVNNSDLVRDKAMLSRAMQSKDRR